MLARPASTSRPRPTALAAAGLLSTAILFALPVLALPARPVRRDQRAAGRGRAARRRSCSSCCFAFSALDDPFRPCDRGRRPRGRLGRHQLPHRRRLRTRRPRRRVAQRRPRTRSGTRGSGPSPPRRPTSSSTSSRSRRACSRSAHRVDPLLVLLAYVAAATLSMIPITPGGLGFVEAGLAGVLTLAGASPDEAVLATLLYRLFSYWLPLPVGLGASIWFSRRHRDDRVDGRRAVTDQRRSARHGLQPVRATSSGIGARLVRRRLDAHVRDHAGARTARPSTDAR